MLVDDAVLDAAVDARGRASRGAPVTGSRASGSCRTRTAPSAIELAKHAADRLAEHGVEVRVPGPDADSAGLAHLAVELDDVRATGSTS